MLCKYIRCKLCSHSIGQHALSCCMASITRYARGIPWDAEQTAVEDPLREGIFSMVWGLQSSNMYFVAGIRLGWKWPSLSLSICACPFELCVYTHISFRSIEKQACNTAKSLGWITSTEDTEAQRNLVRPSLWAHHQACCAPFRPSSSGLHSLFGSQVVVVMLGATNSYKSMVGAKKPHSRVVTPTGQIDADLCWRRQSSFGCIL